MVYFTNSSTTTHYSQCATTGRISNVLTPASVSSTSADCSFAGGCTFNVSYPGLSSSLKLENTYVTVCGKPTFFSESLSTASNAVLTMPRLPTTYSLDNFAIVEEDYIYGTPYSLNSTATSAPFDGDIRNGYI